MAALLIVEDDHDFRELVATVFREAGHEVDEAPDGAIALERIRSRKFDVILSDLKLPLSSGMDILQEAHFMSPDTEVIVMTAYASMDGAVDALRAGAFDYLQKPFSIPELEMRVDRALRQRRLAREVEYLRHEQDVIYRFEDIVGPSPGMQEVLVKIREAAETDGNCILKGENGTGRHLLAGAIHFNSRRKEKGFVRVHCAGTLQSYLESDLFGHVKGAFQEAHKMRVGRLEQAAGGTIFLEDVGEMHSDTQRKLLDFLKTGVFRRLGDTREVRSDVRVMASTRRDLDQMAVDGKFLPELSNLLAGVVISLPPLRERREDIPVLASYFLSQIKGEMDGERARTFSARAMRKLTNYKWPGNVRELRNVLERALLTAKGEVLDAGDIQLPGDKPTPGATFGLSDMQLKDLEKEAVMEALRKTNFVQKEAAKLLGISKRVIHYKIQQFGIKHPRWIRNK